MLRTGTGTGTGTGITSWQSGRSAVPGRHARAWLADRGPVDRTSALRRAGGAKRTIQFAVADRFGEMACGDVCAVVEIGDGARNAQDAMHRACGQLQLFDGALQQHLIVVLQTAMAVGVGLVQLRIGQRTTCKLSLSRGDHAGTYAGAVFTEVAAAQRLRREAWHFDMQIDAVQQRAGDAAAVAADAVAAAAAAPAAIACPAGRAHVSYVMDYSQIAYGRKEILGGGSVHTPSLMMDESEMLAGTEGPIFPRCCVRTFGFCVISCSFGEHGVSPRALRVVLAVRPEH